MYPGVWQTRPVGLDVALRVAPEAACHPWIGGAKNQFAHAAAHRLPLLICHVGSDTWDSAGERAWFERLNRGAANNATGNLGAAGVIDDGALAATDMLKEPLPGFGGPGFAAGAKQHQRAQIM